AQDREECLNAGMDDHLSKPFSMLTLQNMLDRWMPHAAPAQTQAAESAGRAPAKPSEVIERQVLEQLAKVLTNGKPELLTRVINLYLTESPKLMHKLKQASANGDASEIVRSAHSLKSSSANVGAMGLSRYCADIEASARRGDTEEAGRIFARIEVEHGRALAALTAEFEQLAAKV
ncbi:MAG: Hpt domain-containing protein, partial [Burkholderiales bacterium]